jgi:hypothetical protein
MSQKKTQLFNPLNGNINVTGVVTASSFVGDLTGDVTGTATGLAAGATGSDLTLSGNLSIGGTLSYQDVENIDSIGIITAQQGIQVLANGLDITGVSTFKSNVSIADSIIHTGDTDTSIRFPAADTFTVETGGSEALRVDSSQNTTFGTTSESSTSVNITASTSGSCLLSFNDTNSGQGGIRYFHSTDHMQFHTADAEVLRIDSSGRLLLGTTTEGNGGADQLTISTSEHTGVTLRSGTTHQGNIFFADGTSGDDEFRGIIRYDHNDNSMQLRTNATEAARFDSSQRLLVNTTSSSSNIAGYGNGGIQLNSTTTAQANVNIIHRSNSANTHAIVLAKARDGGANGGRVQDDDDFGAISFQGFDGTGGTTYRQGAEIRGAVDGTPGNADMPGRLEFLTTPDGSATPTERLRIDSRGSMLFSNGFMSETVKINTTARTGTQAVNLDEGMAHYFSTNSTGTWKPNFTMSAGDDINATIATGDVFSPTMIVAKGATSHYATTIQVDGSDVTPEFSGGAPSDGGGSGTFDVYNYTIIKTGDDTFKAFAAVSTYE